MRCIDELHMQYPFAGSRMMRDLLNRQGHHIGRRHTRTLMKKMGIQALYCKPNLSQANQAHRKYPYLLKGLAIQRSNQVWSTDITYIPMAKGFVYLCAVIDWHSRKVLAHRVSISMEVDFCISALNEAIEKYGRPEIFNTDQGSQFTSDAFIDVLDFLHKSFFNQFNCLSFTQSKLYMPASKLNRRFNLLRRFLYTQDKILKHFILPNTCST